MTKKDTLGLRVELKGESAREFERIKKEKGLKQNSEVIRLLIREAYCSLQIQEVPIS